MKKHFSRLPVLVVLLALFSSLLTSAAQARTVKLFIIGNSFSGNAMRYMPQIVKATGDELVVGRAELGGHSLQQHWSYVEAAEANPEDPKGKAYANKTKSLRDLISANTWDYVTIQQYSAHSSDVDTYRPYAEKLVGFIKKLQPQAEIVMHQTWAYRSDAKTFGALHLAKNERTKTQQEMYENSRAAYHTIAGELGLRIIPVGDAFWTVSQDPKWGYKKDPNYDFANPVAPNLPDQTNSLNVGYSWGKNKGVDTLNFDANHANDAGCYLAGLIWYGFFFKESPEKVTFAPPSLSPEFAAYLRQVAAQTLAAK